MKETSIGLIPEDWEVKSLSQIGVFSKGKGVTRADAQSGDIPCIRYGEIYTSHNDYIREFYSHISPKIAANATKLKKGDILFAGSGETKEEIGKAVAFLGDEEAYAGGDIIILSPNDGVSSKFLGYVLNGAIAVSQKASMGQGDAVVHIHAKELGDVVIPLPNLTEQKRIAAALSGVDDMIGALDEAIAKKRQIKEGLMQQLLTGKTRLPGFCGEWKREPLSKHASVLRGGSPRPIEAYLTNDPDGINWIKIGDVGVGAKYIVKTEERIIPDGVSHSRAVKAGDFLLSNSMSFGRPYILKIDGCIHDGWLVIQEYYDSFDTDYLYYALNASETIEQYKSMAAGSSVLNLNKDIVKRVMLNIPKIDEQRAIASVLSSVDNEIVELESKRTKYVLIKQGMMQELLTGKTRLI